MKNKNLNVEELNKIATLGKEKWKTSARFILENDHWRRDAAVISLKVLDALEDQNLTYQDLARRMSVSSEDITNIVKGRQNLRLGTIRKLECALGITLITLS